MWAPAVSSTRGVVKKACHDFILLRTNFSHRPALGINFTTLFNVSRT